MPGNYMGNPLVPTNGNLMLYGNAGLGESTNLSYYLYLNQGGRNNNNAGNMANRGYGTETTTHKGYGTRIKASMADGQYSVGMSAYTYRPTSMGTDEMGMMIANVLDQSTMTAVDVDLFLPAGIHAQAEYATHTNPTGNKDTDEPRVAYYFRLIYEGGDYAPFIMFDSFKDPQNAIYKFQNDRIGVGLGKEISKNFYAKAEYHYHIFKEDVVGEGISTTTMSSGMEMEMKMASETEANTQTMMRTSLIFYF